MITVLGGMWLQQERTEPGMTEAELQQAALEARLVLGLTSRALKRGDTAVGQVLTGEVSPALKKVPIRWPTKDNERSGS